MSRISHGNCHGTCEAIGTMHALPGSSMADLIHGMRGPNEYGDKLSSHEGDQYRGGNTDGPDIHVSYIPGKADESMHFDWRFPFGSAGGLWQHSKDYVVNEFSKGSDPDPSYDKVGP